MDLTEPTSGADEAGTETAFSPRRAAAVERAGEPALEATLEATPARPAKKTEAARPLKRKPPVRPFNIVLHLYATIDGELTKLEEQSGDSSQDRERASRALSQIMNALEKAFAMQRKIKKAMKRTTRATDKEEFARAEDLRQKLAERVARFALERDDPDRSEPAR